MEIFYQTKVKKFQDDLIALHMYYSNKNVHSSTDENIFILYRFYRQLLFFTIYFIISFIAFHYRPECMNVTKYTNCGNDKGALNATKSYDLNSSFIDNSYTTSIFTEISGMYSKLCHVSLFLDSI